MENHRVGLFAACECHYEQGLNKSADGAICFVMVAKDVRINGTGGIYAQSPGGAGSRMRG